MAEQLLFAGTSQPARRSFGIDELTIGGERIPVTTCDMAASPFCALVELTRADRMPQRDVIIVAPLSGHFPILLRDLVVGLLPSSRVLVTDWINVRHVPAHLGDFDLGSNVATIIDLIRHARSPPLVIALCQGGMPALAATALLEAASDAAAPSGLVLIASPIDPLANPTRVSCHIRGHGPDWFESRALSTVADPFAGVGRRVYPANHQLAVLSMYLARRIVGGGQLWAKLVNDDGADPERFPFLDLYTSIMDLDATHFLDNIRLTYLDRAICEGALRYRGTPVNLEAIRHAALMTIEGEWDDIAAPGQTAAALALCKSVSADARQRLVVPGCGHFSLFHGELCRRRILPAIAEFRNRCEHKA